MNLPVTYHLWAQVASEDSTSSGVNGIVRFQ